MAVTLTDIDDLRVFQRTVATNNASVPVSGTYTGSPTQVEARVVNDVGGAEVVGWTVIDASPAGGTFSGNITVPEGGNYNVQVRDDIGGSDNGTNEWGVGILVLVIGQSNAARLFTTSSSPDAPNATTAKYDGSWGSVTGNGAIKLANKLQTATSLPIELLNYALGATSLRKENEGANGYWWDEDLGQGSSIYDAAITGVTAVGGNVEYVVWSQGETDASFDNATKAEYKTSLGDMLLEFRTDIDSGLKFVFSTLGRDTTGGIITDASCQNIRDAQAEYIASDNLTFRSATKIDLALAGDGIHFTAASYETEATRLSQVIKEDLGIVAYQKGPTIDDYKLVSTSVIDVNITHDGGTDFTPTTGIAGFEVLDDGSSETINTAVRQDATTIRLTIAGTIDGALTVRYLYGLNPDAGDTANYVSDNTALTMPLEYSSAITAQADLFVDQILIKQTGDLEVDLIEFTQTGTLSVDQIKFSQSGSLDVDLIEFGDNTSMDNQEMIVDTDTGEWCMRLGGKRMPTWNTANRPSSPFWSQFGFNTQTSKLEIYLDGWKSVTLS